MKEIFTDIYNKVIEFFKQTEPQTSTKDVACNRLRVVLMQDRTNLTPELMERMRKELVELLSKYVEMDKEALDLNLMQDGDQVALTLSIPVLRAKDKEETEKALAADNKEEEKDSGETVSDNDEVEAEAADNDYIKETAEEGKTVEHPENLRDTVSEKTKK